MKYNLDLVMEEENSLTKIIREIKPNSCVLEFGPANGRMTRYLKEVKHCDVYIVEIDEEAAKDAMQYAVDSIIDDIENYDWINKWKDISFDYITFADVLEHLLNPQQVLSRTKALLKEDGEVLFSVPNVAHNSILINLYNNIFNYTPLGLLDNTHIHLFAYNTLKEFCSYAGYTPVIEDAVYSQVGENEVTARYEDIAEDIASRIKRRKFGHVYQFVFTLMKNEYVKFNPVAVSNRIVTYIPTNKLQVFLDRGNSWCEENCITQPLTPQGEKHFEINLKGQDNIRSIRIDPVDTCGIIELNRLALEYEDGSVEEISVESVTSNAACNIEQLFIFETSDPQFVLEVCGVRYPTKLILSLKYENCGEQIYSEVINQLIRSKEIQSSFNNLVEENKKLMSQLTQKDVEYSQLGNELKLAQEEMERRLIEINNRGEELNSQNEKIMNYKNKQKQYDVEMLRIHEDLIREQNKNKETRLNKGLFKKKQSD